MIVMMTMTVTVMMMMMMMMMMMIVMRVEVVKYLAPIKIQQNNDSNSTAN